MVFHIDLPLLPYCCYTITDQSGEVQFVGACPTADILHHAGPHMKRLSGTITLSVIEMVHHPYAARNLVYGWVRERGLPPLNKRLPNFNRPVQCVDTGVKYKNAAQAARSHDISTGLMSKHLAGDPIYTRVRGLTFEYMETINETTSV